MAKLFRFMGLNSVENRAQGCYVYDEQDKEYT